jgi:broad specificity phosphatase PhoE
MTTVYLIRHSKCLNIDISNSKDNLLSQNEKKILSIEGENIAKEKLSSSLFDNVDSIYSSNYTRAIATAKYVSERNNKNIVVLDELGERIHGVNSWDELPPDFEKNQLLDENYKIGYGENRKEVTDRMYSSLMKIVNDNKDKTVAIVSHATAITFLLMKWCTIDMVDNKIRYMYKDKILLNDFFDHCETFRLDFDDNTLINIENIKY